MTDIKEQIKAKATIVEVVSEFVALRKAGTNYLGLCPFHNEKTPSFTVSPAKGLYKCFGCGQSGDLFSFVMEIEKLEFKDALKWLALKYKIDVPADDKSYYEHKKDNEREPYRIVTRWAINYFKGLLTGEGQKGRDYLQTRGFTGIDIKNWNIGYTGTSFTDIIDSANKAGISLKLLAECGLVGEKEGKYYNRLIDRVVFPYTDNTGNFTGYTARVIESDSKFAKYINSSTNPLFDKGQTLFGIDKARKAIINQRECILCEGPTDVISMHKAGINNCVCVSGTAIEASHLQIIRRMADTLVIMLDGDKAGQAATLKSIDNAINEGFTVYITELPDKHDPDSFIRAKGAEEAVSYINKNRIDFLEYKAIKLIEPVKNNPAELTEAIKKVAATVGLIADPLKRNVYIKRIANKTDISSKDIERLLIDNNTDTEEKGLYLFNEAKEAIENRKVASVYNTKTKALEHILRGHENTIAITKPLNNDELTQLKALTPNLYWEDAVPDIYDSKNQETQFTKFLKKLIALGFNISIDKPGDPDIETGEIVTERTDFVDYYIEALMDNLRPKKYDSKYIQKTVEKMAELVSYLGEAVQTIKINYIKSLFKGQSVTFSIADFKRVMKPYLRTQKETRKNEVTIEVNNPHGLNENQLKTQNDYGLFYKNNCIWFDSTDGGVKSKSNFIIQPIIHTIGINSRKLFKLVNVFGIEAVINVSTQEMNNLTKFLCAIEEKGNYRFDGEPQDLRKLKKYLYDRTIYSAEIENLGWQPENFWAWADGITMPDKTFQPITDYGLVKVPKNGNDIWYYIKPFSKLYVDDKNVFVQERKFRHTTSDIKLKDWCHNFVEVYGEKSLLSLAAMLTTCFGDFIFARLGALPLINIFGPKGTGKTEQAKSILSCFGEKQNEVNMTKVTPYAAAHNLKMFINAFVLFDEYKNSLTTEWIELMKSIYNRQPRIRGTIKEGQDTIAIPVNSMIFMCGQEMPTADPALLSRCVFISQYNPEHTHEEKKKYNEFKEIDNAGKSHFIDEIISNRGLIERNYMDVFYELEKKMGEMVRSNTEDRVIKNYAALLTTYKILHKELGLEWDMDKLIELSLMCMEEQMSILSTSNEIGTFWSIFQSLIDRQIISFYTNYKVEIGVAVEMDVIVEGKRKRTIKEFDKDGTELLYLRWAGLYQLIAEAAKRSGSDVLPEKSLLYYMTHHSSFVGYRESQRFGANTNQAMVFNYKQLCEWTGIDITKVPLPKAERKEEKAAAPTTPKDELPF